DVASVPCPGRDIHLDVGRVIPVHKVITVRIAAPSLRRAAALLNAVAFEPPRLIGAGSFAVSNVVGGEAGVSESYPELMQDFVSDHNASAAVVEERVVHGRD